MCNIVFTVVLHYIDYLTCDRRRRFYCTYLLACHVDGVILLARHPARLHWSTHYAAIMKRITNKAFNLYRNTFGSLVSASGLIVINVNAAWLFRPAATFYAITVLRNWLCVATIYVGLTTESQRNILAR